MSEKDKKVDFDAETNGQHEAEAANNAIAEFEELDKAIVACPEGTGRMIAKNKVMHLIAEFNKRGKFAIPKEALDAFFGFTPDTTKNRAYTYTKKINNQFADDNTINIFKIGVSGQDFYTIDMT